jgi:nucleotide-binding universal stress UspA family protein
MMQKIIVPIDFSKESFAGLKMAKVFASKTGADILMIHVIRNNEIVEPEILKSEYQLVMSKFDDILLENKEEDFKYSLSYVIKEGKIFEEVVKLADKRENSMIVLSTHGASGFEEYFIGGDAFKIVSHSNCPVVTVRRGAFSSSIDKIVLPLDIDFQTREKVPYTAKLAKLFGSEIHILTVNTTKSEEIDDKLQQYANQVEAYIKTQNVPYSIHHTKGNNFTDLTLEYSSAINANLVSIMTEQDESFSNLLMGSYAHQMINKAIVPVLIFPIFQISTHSESFRTSGSDY